MNYKCNNCKDTKILTSGFDQHIKFCKECESSNDEQLITKSLTSGLTIAETLSLAETLYLVGTKGNKSLHFEPVVPSPVLPKIEEKDGEFIITNLKESLISQVERTPVLPKKRGRPPKNG